SLLCEQGFPNSIVSPQHDRRTKIKQKNARHPSCDKKPNNERVVLIGCKGTAEFGPHVQNRRESEDYIQGEVHEKKHRNQQNEAYPDAENSSEQMKAWIGPSLGHAAYHIRPLPPRASCPSRQLPRSCRPCRRPLPADGHTCPRPGP